MRNLAIAGGAAGVMSLGAVSPVDLGTGTDRGAGGMIQQSIHETGPSPR